MRKKTKSIYHLYKNIFERKDIFKQIQNEMYAIMGVPQSFLETSWIRVQPSTKEEIDARDSNQRINR